MENERLNGREGGLDEEKAALEERGGRLEADTGVQEEEGRDWNGRRAAGTGGGSLEQTAGGRTGRGIAGMSETRRRWVRVVRGVVVGTALVAAAGCEPLLPGLGEPSCSTAANGCNREELTINTAPSIAIYIDKDDIDEARCTRATASATVTINTLEAATCHLRGGFVSANGGQPDEDNPIEESPQDSGIDLGDGGSFGPIKRPASGCVPYYCEESPVGRLGVIFFQ